MTTFPAKKEPRKGNIKNKESLATLGPPVLAVSETGTQTQREARNDQESQFLENSAAKQEMT